MAKVNIKGVIIPNDDQWIYDWLEMDATSPKSVQRELEAAGNEDIEVFINSGGGSVFAGSEIYTTLKLHPGNVTVKIVGIAASAASVIAMAGQKVMMAPTAQIMIHNASTGSYGDYRDMEHTAGILKTVNETVANAYMLKSGMDRQEFLDMMDEETWLAPQQALEKKLIDEIMFENTAPQIVASAGVANMVPEQLINKLRNMKDTLNPTEPSGKNPQDNQADLFMREKLNAQLKLLKLKGDSSNE